MITQETKDVIVIQDEDKRRISCAFINKRMGVTVTTGKGSVTLSPADLSRLKHWIDNQLNEGP